MLWVSCFSELNYFFNYAFSSITLNIRNLHYKDPNWFVFIFLVLNTVFITVYHGKAVRDDIPLYVIPIWLHHTIFYTKYFDSYSYICFSKLPLLSLASILPILTRSYNLSSYYWNPSIIQSSPSLCQCLI